MKKISLLFITILLLSCNSKPRNFEGIGEIKLGKNFNSLTKSKFFKRIKENEYKIDRIKISEQVGFVKNLTIKLENSQIYDVSFESTKSTNNSVIDSLMEVFGKHSMLKIEPSKSAPFQIIEKSDGDVDFSKIIEKKYPSEITYRYFDIKKLINIVDAEE